MDDNGGPQFGRVYISLVDSHRSPHDLRSVSTAIAPNNVLNMNFSVISLRADGFVSFNAIDMSAGPMRCVLSRKWCLDGADERIISLKSGYCFVMALTASYRAYLWTIKDGQRSNARVLTSCVDAEILSGIYKLK